MQKKREKYAKLLPHSYSAQTEYIPLIVRSHGWQKCIHKPPPSGCLCVFVSSLQLLNYVIRVSWPSHSQRLQNIKDKSFISLSTEADDAKCPPSAPTGPTNRINSMYVTAELSEEDFRWFARVCEMYFQSHAFLTWGFTASLHVYVDRACDARTILTLIYVVRNQDEQPRT